MSFKTRGRRTRARRPSPVSRTARPRTYTSLLLHDLGTIKPSNRSVSRRRSEPHTTADDLKHSIVGGHHLLVSTIAAAFWLQQPLVRLWNSAQQPRSDGQCPRCNMHDDAVEIWNILYCTSAFALHRSIVGLIAGAQMLRRILLWCRARGRRAVLAWRLMHALPEIVLVVLAIEATVLFILFVMLVGVTDRTSRWQAQRNMDVLRGVLAALFEYMRL